ncbi:hypothetical protein THRCLA_06200 [Thraustotheca clavata]|uniref:BRCT domain-containing protein n=1 Tax=Thraustotheca clavata TaxID=74557 RepID=A0A1V9ZQB4_9STRA|nr:hypothetical protein THRCLA_06200 [Thraustotheca clavata]
MKFFIPTETVKYGMACAIIQDNGGQVLSEFTEGCIKLVDSHKLDKRDEKLLNVTYIFECVKARKILDRKNFMVTEDWVESNDSEIKRKNARKKYTVEEQAAMLHFIEEQGRELDAACHRKFWQMAAIYKVTEHSWESMHEHHRKILLKKPMRMKREILAKFTGYADGTSNRSKNDESSSSHKRSAPEHPEKAKAPAKKAKTTVAAVSEEDGDEDAPPDMYPSLRSKTAKPPSNTAPENTRNIEGNSASKRKRMRRAVMNSEAVQGGSPTVRGKAVVAHQSISDNDDIEGVDSDLSEPENNRAIPVQRHTRRSIIVPTAPVSPNPTTSLAPPSRPQPTTESTNSTPEVTTASRSAVRVLETPPRTARPVVQQSPSQPNITSSHLKPFPFSTPSTADDLAKIKKFMFLHSGMPIEAIDHALYSTSGNPVIALQYLRGTLPLGCWTPDEDTWIYDNFNRLLPIEIQLTDDEYTSIIEETLKTNKLQRPHTTKMITDRIRFLQAEQAKQVL